MVGVELDEDIGEELFVFAVDFEEFGESFGDVIHYDVEIDFICLDLNHIQVRYNKLYIHSRLLIMYGETSHKCKGDK